VFWLLRVSVTGVLDEVDAGGRNQTGTAPLHVLTMTTWSRSLCYEDALQAVYMQQN